MHLSHNRITDKGAAALLKRIPSPALSQARLSPAQLPSAASPPRQHAGGHSETLGSADLPQDVLQEPSSSATLSSQRGSDPPASSGTAVATLPVSAADQFASLLKLTPARQQGSHKASDSGSHRPDTGVCTPSSEIAHTRVSEPTSGGQMREHAAMVGQAPSDPAALEDTASSPDPAMQSSQAVSPQPAPSSSPSGRQSESGRKSQTPSMPHSKPLLSGSKEGSQKTARKPLWLRLEWNQISLSNFLQVSGCLSACMTSPGNASSFVRLLICLLLPGAYKVFHLVCLVTAEDNAICSQETLQFNWENQDPLAFDRLVSTGIVAPAAAGQLPLPFLISDAHPALGIRIRNI